MNRSAELPLTHLLDRLSGLCDQLSLEELAQYQGLCALEAAMLEPDLRQARAGQ